MKKQSSAAKKPKLKRVEARVGGTTIAGDYPVEQHPEHGAVLGLDSVRSFELDAVAKLITRPDPLNGEHIRFIRRVLHLDQKALAASLGLTRQTVIRYERSAHVPVSTDFAIRFLAQLKLAVEGRLINLHHAVRAKAAASPRSAAQALFKRVPDRLELIRTIE
jgi:transcriptional regulator with XRE-family HTH domain